MDRRDERIRKQRLRVQRDLMETVAKDKGASQAARAEARARLRWITAMLKEG